METPVIAAIITSIASCIVSVVSWISVRNSSKNNGKTQLEIEILKYKLDVRKNINAFNFKVAERQIDAIENLISTIQEMKDLYSIIIEAPPNTVKAKPIILELEKLSKKSLEIFNGDSSCFEGKSFVDFHRMKHNASAAGVFARVFILTENIDLGEHHLNSFKMARDSYTNDQEKLRGVRKEIISEIEEKVKLIDEA